jgi:hypothetical protein
MRSLYLLAFLGLLAVTGKAITVPQRTNLTCNVAQQQRRQCMLNWAMLVIPCANFLLENYIACYNISARL